MSIEVYTIKSSGRSAVLVNDHEKRVHREMDHLLSDIRRINPQGAPYCTFGELFVDPVVEQYYEALVGTMRAAKRNGLITFKGQFLLKGIHDKVMVRIIDSNGDGDVPEKSNNENSTGTAHDGTKMVGVENNNQHEKPKSKSTKPADVSDIISKQAILQENGDNDACALSSDTKPAKAPYRPKFKARIGLKRTQSMQIETPRKNYNNDITHIPSAGIAFEAKKKPETHLERVDREVKQLLVDILRINPEGSPYCTFGSIFEDAQVEQYYEALVGTLKSAKRKGLIRFKGQMLLKGMHDNVQIDIV